MRGHRLLCNATSSIAEILRDQFGCNLRQVGVAAGTYIPPGPMLNAASTRLACLEDVEIDVSPPGAPQHLFRRRVFAPEDNRDERYLTASDVVKVSSLLLCRHLLTVTLAD